MKTLLISFFVLNASLGYSQYKYQIGFKTSTLSTSQLQIEQRIILNPKLTLFASYNRGQETSGNFFSGQITGDTIVNQYNNSNINRFHYGKLGIQRSLSLAKNDFFYFGGAIGVGYKELHFEDSRLVIYNDEMGQFLNPETLEMQTVESSVIKRFNSGAFYELTSSFGMNVPIFERFIINCALNLTGQYSKNSVDTSAYSVRLIPNVSGGVFYSFGK